jgi:hypothetical protein
MAFKSFRDFEQYPTIVESDFLVGYREIDKEFKIPVGDINTFLAKSAVTAPNVLYVNLSGNDQNNGFSEGTAMRTIKRACAKALHMSRQISAAQKAVEGDRFGLLSKSVNIFVRAGDYVEDNPIYLPPGCTLIGDNLRAVTIIPKNKFYDIIWINNRCYVWGFTFRQHKKPSYAVAYPIFQYLSGGQVLDALTLPYAPYNQSTRVRSATALATQYFSLCGDRGRESYVPTKITGNSLINLSDDKGPNNPPFPGQSAITPFQVAFLKRYFENLENDFFTQDEQFTFNYEFWETFWFRSNVKRPFTLTSPYPQGCSSITQQTEPGRNDAGGGVLVDGNDVDGPLRSMVMDSFTQFNEGGKGIHIVNNGYAQLVSTFTICCTEGVMCETGGTCSINTSNCSFGLSGLVATGKSPRPALVGNLKFDIIRTTNQVVITNLGRGADPDNISKQEFKSDYQPYPGQVFELVDRSQVNNTQTGYLTATNSGTYFTILTASPIFKWDPSDSYYTSVIELELNYSFTDDTSISAVNFTPPVSSIRGQSEIPGIYAGSEALFYIRSTITTSAHTMEYIGTGTTLLNAVPQKGGITDVNLEVVTDGIGKIFFTTTNQFGDFKIGPGLTIVQATGTIEGDTFRRSILQTITPFTIALSN